MFFPDVDQLFNYYGINEMSIVWRKKHDSLTVELPKCSK